MFRHGSITGFGTSSVHGRSGASVFVEVISFHPLQSITLSITKKRLFLPILNKKTPSLRLKNKNETFHEGRFFAGLHLMQDMLEEEIRSGAWHPIHLPKPNVTSTKLTSQQLCAVHGLFYIITLPKTNTLLMKMMVSNNRNLQTSRKALFSGLLLLVSMRVYYYSGVFVCTWLNLTDPNSTLGTQQII